MQTELVIGFMYDVTLGGYRSTVDIDFTTVANDRVGPVPQHVRQVREVITANGSASS